MGTKRKLVEEQINIFFEIQAAGFNIVNCGNCGTLLLHRLTPTLVTDFGKSNIKCFGCMQEMEYSDCPDYWYEHDENSSVFDEEKPFTEWCKEVTINSNKL